MKKCRKVISLLLIACMMTAMASMVMATNQTVCTQFDYAIYDRDGNVIEQGTTPDFRTRYSWSGITLQNDESVALRPVREGGDFYIIANLQTSFEYTLDRPATTVSNIAKRTLPGNYISVYSERATTIAARISYKTTETGYYYVRMQNYSSDPIVIKSALFTF